MSLFFNQFIIWYLMLLASTVTSQAREIVDTSSGLVRGMVNEYKGTKYYSYLGIPYAENPTGDLRFQPPVPKRRWSGIYDTTQDGPVCPQPETRYKKSQMSEDCLVLNIYVPVMNNSDTLLPVVVNIHGGGFRILSGDSHFMYGPQLLLQKSIVYVSVNYRLSALGFLSLNVENSSGNTGIKDVILSIKWLRQNIIKFNGNKNKITVMGNSSGASIVHFLMLSKKTSNLFQQSILFSGSALNHRVISRYPTEIAIKLASELGIQTDKIDIQTLIETLKQIDPYELSDVYDRMRQANQTALKTTALFVPNIEVKSSHAVITKQPRAILNDGLPQNVRVLVGINSMEGLYMIPQIKERFEDLKHIHENTESLIPSNIEYPLNSAESISLGDSIFKFYLRNESTITDTNYDRIIEYISDIQYVYNVDLWTRIHKSRSDSKELYFYEFAFDGLLNWGKKTYNISETGVSHADEMGYLFITNSTKDIFDSVDERTRQMVHTMVDLITNFIRHGNPTPPHLNNDIIWPEYGVDQNYLVINDELTVMRRNSSERYIRMCFWDDVYDDYYKYIKHGGKLQKKIEP